MKLFTTFFFVLLIIIPTKIYAQQRVTPYSGSRIFWDKATEKVVFSSGNYGRLIQLKDNRLMAVAQFGPGVGVSVSSNMGNTWSTPVNIAPHPNLIVNSVPDIYQMTDGTILVGYNPRPKTPYSADRKFGIRLRQSTDNGVTWSKEIFVYDAAYTNADGCWEPAFLELPSGELQCYFANEYNYQTTNEQNISVCRSFDKGLTWSSPEIVCFRSGSRDGMPVPLLLQGSQDIVVAIEDNGYPGYKPRFQPSIIKSTLANNWKSGFVNGNSPNRIYAMSPALPTSTKAAAPYIRQLPWGETIISYQGSAGRASTNDSELDMFVAVGNNQARNFKAVSRPFAVSLNKKALWNSLSVIDTGIVVAVTSTNQYTTNNQIRMIKGYPIRKVHIEKGTITVDGERSTAEKWSTENADQLIMGVVAKARAAFDFVSDETNLYFTVKVDDKEIISNTATNDGVSLMLDVDDVSTTSPSTGTFKLFFDVNGTVSMQKGLSGSWINTAATGIDFKVKKIVNQSYTIEVAIPWTTLGKTTPPVDKRLAIGLELRNVNTSGTITETIADVNKNAPYTWVETYLSTNIANTLRDVPNNNNEVKLFQRANDVEISTSIPVLKYDLYSIDGRLFKSELIGSKLFIVKKQLSPSIIILYFEDRSVVSKLIVQQ